MHSSARSLNTLRRQIKSAAWCLALASLAAGLSAATATGTTTSAGTQTADLEQDVAAVVAAGAPGAILLVRDGNDTARFTAGVADRATQRAIAPADHYRIASLTKSYVATVVLQLVQEKKLRLDDTVERWLPGVLRRGDKITIRMLLNHTSGLYDHEKDPEVLKPYLSGKFGYFWAPTRLVKLADSRPGHYAPGHTKVSTYSSTNYSVLGLVVHAVTGRLIGTELKQRIFQPLHLAGTSYPLKRITLPEPYAHGYFNLGDGSLTDLSEFSPSLSGAAGAIVSTVDDVASFYRALLSGRLLEPAQLRAMQTTLANPTGDLHQRYGLGVERFATSCGAAWGHSGSFPGYWTYGWSSADGKRQVVLMSNIDPTAVTPAARTAFYRTLDDAYCSAK
jgi:D-alanyl-D-alanine carboxypeptidase